MDIQAISVIINIIVGQPNLLTEEDGDRVNLELESGPLWAPCNPKQKVDHNIRNTMQPLVAI